MPDLKSNMKPLILPLTRTCTTTIAAIGVVIIMTMPLPVLSADKAAADDSVTDLEDVSVIGSKAGRNLQDSYSSIGVITGTVIEDQRIQDVREALNRQANVYVAPSNNGNNGISIRGINSEGISQTGTNLRPLMTMTIDGAVQSTEGIRRGARGTWDVQQIEVLRGPQTTTPGRSALAGAISIETRDPTPYWEFAARIGADTLDYVLPAAMISGPITDELSFRLTAESIDGRKDISYTEPSNEFLADDEYTNVRGKLLYKPAGLDTLSIKLTVSDTTDSPAVTAVTGTGSFDPFQRIFDGTNTAAENRENDVRFYSAEIAYEINPQLLLKSITAYIETDAKLIGVGGITGNPYNRDELRVNTEITQEIRLEFTANKGKLNGVTGLYYGDSRNEIDSLVTLGTGILQDLLNKTDDKNAAVFGDVRYRFAESWQFILGARYVVDTSDTDYNNREDKILTRTHLKDDALLPNTGLIYTIDQDSSIGFTVRQGYRSGFVERGRKIEPETLTSYELAWRNLYLDGSLMFNANVFYNDWRDQQITISLGIERDQITENAGKSKVIGAELETSWEPRASGFSLGGSIGFLQTELVDYQSDAIAFDISGNEFPEAPRISGGIWSSYRFAEAWIVTANMNARSSAFATGDLTNQETFKVPGYALVNVRGGYERENWSVLAGINNLLDKEYLTGRDIFGGYYVGDAITYSIELKTYF